MKMKKINQPPFYQPKLENEEFYWKKQGNR